jgi:hypothetical protein
MLSKGEGGQQRCSIIDMGMCLWLPDNGCSSPTRLLDPAPARGKRAYMVSRPSWPHVCDTRSLVVHSHGH